MRRQFLKSLAIAPMYFGIANAQSIQGISTAPPYKEVNIPLDRNVVRLFISFDCPYSMDSFESFSEWGKTLPRSLRFEVDQIASSSENIPYAVIWNAVKKVGTPKEQFEFAQTFFSYVRAQTIPPSNPDFYSKLFKEAKIPNLALAVKATNKKELLAQVKRDYKYKITATPSFGIGGKFSASPEGTNGDYALYMELINGLVSQILG